VVFGREQMHRLLVTAVGARVGMLVAGEALRADHGNSRRPRFLGDRAAAALTRQETDPAGEDAI
jgi:hypothetical protein